VLAAYTPNTPWAALGCPALVNHDGAGTSSATPQSAAAAALRLQQVGPQGARPWQSVGAVRRECKAIEHETRARAGQPGPTPAPGALPGYKAAKEALGQSRAMVERALGKLATAGADPVQLESLRRRIKENLAGIPPSRRPPLLGGLAVACRRRSSPAV